MTFRTNGIHLPCLVKGFFVTMVPKSLMAIDKHRGLWHGVIPLTHPPLTGVPSVPTPLSRRPLIPSPLPPLADQLELCVELARVAERDHSIAEYAAECALQLVSDHGDALIRLTRAGEPREESVDPAA